MEAKSSEAGNNKVDTIETWLTKHRLMYVGATRHPFVLSIRDGSIDFHAFKRWLVLLGISKRKIKFKPYILRPEPRYKAFELSCHESIVAIFLPRDFSLGPQLSTGNAFQTMRRLHPGQDYIFVRACVPLVASLLLKAWKETDDNSDIDIILGSVASLNDGIAWFKKEASKWNVALTSIVPQQPNLEYCRFLESLMAQDVEYTVAIAAFWAMGAVYQESFAHCLEDGSRTPEELKETCQMWGNDDFCQYCSSLRSIANRMLGKASDDVVAKAEAAFLRVLEHEVDFWNMSRGEI